MTIAQSKPFGSSKTAGAARIGIGGPVGSGKTALIERLIPVFQRRGIDLAIVTNDLVTHEDAERIRRSVELAPWRVPPVTISVGVMSLCQPMTAEELLKLADQALYQAKDAGRNRVVHAAERHPDPAVA